MRHEEAAAFAAGAEAHLTGKIAVCAGSCGPGNLHLINGLYDCQRSRVPVLAIAAQIPSAELGSGYFQETHPEQLFTQCSHYCELVSQPEQMPRVLEIAIQTALSRQGVAVIAIPGDVLLRDVKITKDAVHDKSQELRDSMTSVLTPGAAGGETTREQYDKLPKGAEYTRIAVNLAAGSPNLAQVKACPIVVAA